MKILITGSSGMIGSELVSTLKSYGHDVWGMDKVWPKYTSCHFLLCDMREPINLSIKFDLIIHLAANARVHDLVIDPELSLDNVKMTFNILEYARKTGSNRLIFSSSREIYGNGNEMPVKESVGSQRTSESPYASSKLAGESYCHSYRKCYGVDTKIVRFSNVYGKYDFSNRFIPKTIKNCKLNNPIEIWGKDKVLDFTYISDAVSGLVHIIENWPKETEFNIAYGKGETLISVAQRIKDALKSESQILMADSKTGEVAEYAADIGQMNSIGWKPKVAIGEGLTKALDYYENN